MSYKALHKHMFSDPDLNVFAVLDGASVADLLPKLDGERPEFCCLYRGELEPHLAKAAPYLVRLAPQTAFTKWVLDKGWGNHWGIFAVTEQNLREMRRHFRTFLKVISPEGKPLYFRYYDPRVLRVYLPTCTVQEMKTVFGPVESFFVEGEKPEVLLQFTRGKVGPDQKDIDLTQVM